MDEVKNKPIPEEFSYLKDYDIQKIIDRYAKKYKNKKVVIYGAGKLSDYIFNNYDLSKLNIAGIADLKFETKKEELFNNIKALQISELNNINFSAIIIFTKLYKNIESRLSCCVLNKKNKKHIKLEWILDRGIKFYIDNKIKESSKKINENEKYIFTFWEPKEKIPPYIQLCMNTWTKYLKDYKIIILNYKNLGEWLGFEYFDEYLFKNFSLPVQADAIRAAVLYKHGGIWLDADTIITSNKINKIINQNAKFTTFGYHIGFIVAKKGSKVLKVWLKKVKENILKHRLYYCLYFICKYFISYRFAVSLNEWSYLGNLIVDKIFWHANKDEFNPLNRFEYFALPEENYYLKSDVTHDKKYVKFYFENDFSDYVFENEKGIIMLRNAITPDNYKLMNKEEFLNQNFTLARILKKYNEENHD